MRWSETGERLEVRQEVGRLEGSADTYVAAKP